MSNQIEIQIESILLSAVDKLYKKESLTGLDLEDFRVLEIIYKINKEARLEAPTSDKPAATKITQENLIDMIRIARGSPDGQQQ